MIRLFSFFRHRLLREYRFGRYLIYALGEIVLVVIGILIALQVNNWNELRKKNLQADVFREKLIQDITQDTVLINEILEDRKLVKQNIRGYFDFFDEGGHTMYELIDSARQVRWKLFRYLPQDYTFRDMQATGNTALLTEAEREGLIDLANAQDFLLQIIEKQIDEFLEELHKRDAYLGDHISRTNFYETLGIPLSPEDARKGLIHQHNAFSELTELGYIMEGFAVSIKSKSATLTELLKENQKE